MYIKYADNKILYDSEVYTSVEQKTLFSVAGNNINRINI